MVFSEKPLQNFLFLSQKNPPQHLTRFWDKRRRQNLTATPQKYKQPSRPTFVAKALCYRYTLFRGAPLKCDATSGVLRGTPLSDFFGSFLVRTRNEHIIKQFLYFVSCAYKKWVYNKTISSFRFLPCNKKWTYNKTNPLLYLLFAKETNIQ